jgi:hypothetical protein
MLIFFLINLWRLDYLWFLASRLCQTGEVVDHKSSLSVQQVRRYFEVLQILE